MEQTISSSKENHPSFQESLCLQRGATSSSTGDHSRAAMFGGSSTSGFILSRAINADCVHCRHRQQQDLAALCCARRTLAICPHSQRQEKQSSAFHSSEPSLHHHSPAPCLVPDAFPPQALTDPEIDVPFSSTQHQDVLQLLPLGLCGRCAGVL